MTIARTRPLSISALAMGVMLVLPAAAQQAGQQESGPADNTALLDIPSFADVEPEIGFPTCVGIARVVDGAVTTLPVPEGGLWDEQFDMLGEAVGTKVAVLDAVSGDARTLMEGLRADATAQALDYLVLYELAYDQNEESGPTAIQRLRLFPTFEGEAPSDPARAAGAPVLMDVASGAMYGVASAVAMDSEIAQTPGYYAGETAREEAFRAVVAELGHEVQTAFVGVMLKQGLPDPSTIQVEGNIADLTEEQIIAQADREIRAAYGEQDADGGCSAR